MPLGWVVIGLLVVAWFLAVLLVVALCASARRVDEGLREHAGRVLEPVEADPPAARRFEGGVGGATTLN